MLWVLAYRILSEDSGQSRYLVESPELAEGGPSDEREQRGGMGQLDTAGPRY